MTKVHIIYLMPKALSQKLLLKEYDSPFHPLRPNSPSLPLDSSLRQQYGVSLEVKGRIAHSDTAFL